MIDPTYDSFTEWERRRHQERAAYWTALGRAKLDYRKLEQQAPEYVEPDPTKGFYYYLQYNYGLKPHMKGGMLTADYTVTDEKKFLLFQIQYWT